MDVKIVANYILSVFIFFFSMCECPITTFIMWLFVLYSTSYSITPHVIQSYESFHRVKNQLIQAIHTVREMNFVRQDVHV